MVLTREARIERMRAAFQARPQYYRLNDDVLGASASGGKHVEEVKPER